MSSRIRWFVLSTCLLAACGSQSQHPQPGAVKSAVPAKPAQPAAPGPPPPAYPAELRKKGEALYAQMCAVCHGANGEGYKADQAPAIANPEYLASVADYFMWQAIASGRRGSTMSAWAAANGGPLTTQDIAALVGFLRTKETIPRAVLDQHPRTGDAKRGETIYERDCQSCHGVKGEGGPNLRLGDGGLLSAATDGFLRYAITKGRPGTAMRAYGETLGAGGVEDVLAYLRTWPGSPVQSAGDNLAGRPPPLPLGRVVLNPHGPEPRDFHAFPETTSLEIIHRELGRHAKMGFLDARAPTDYTQRHIRGAVSVPFYDPIPYYAKLPKDAWLVCYCACPHAESGELAQKLLAQGFKKVTVLNEGLGAWMAHGYPTNPGEKP